MKEKLEKIIKTHGENNQKLKAIEELDELQIAILNDINKGLNCRNNVIEEIADSLVMIRQLMMIYNIDSEMIVTVMHMKMDREIKRINRQEWIDENLKGQVFYEIDDTCGNADDIHHDYTS